MWFLISGRLEVADTLEEKKKKTEEKLSAEEYRRIAQDHIEEINKIWIMVLKVGIFICAAVIVAIVLSAAWFAMNRRVSSQSTAISSTGLPFDIATKGTVVRNQTIINTFKPEYSEGVSGTFSDNSGSVDTYYTGDSLILRFEPDADDPNTEVDESIPEDIGPGSSGKLNLYVIPKTDDDLKLKISLNVVPYAELEKKDADGNTLLDANRNVITELVEIVNAQDFAQKANSMNNSEEAGKAEDYVRAAKYMKGHILFFGNEGDTSNVTESLRYYFRTPLTDRIIEKDIPTGNENKAIPIPVYWMWTNTLGQIALPDNISGQRSGYPILEDTNTVDKDKITAYLLENKETVFANSGDKTEGNINAVTRKVDNSEAFDNSAFVDLSKGYNQADNLIGTKIAYFMVEVTVELAD